MPERRARSQISWTGSDVFHAPGFRKCDQCILGTTALSDAGVIAGEHSVTQGCYFHFFFNVYLFIGCTGSWLQWARSLVEVCGIGFPDQGLNPGPLHFEFSLSHWTTREVPIFFSFFFFFFWCGPFLKSLLHLLQYCFCFMFWCFGQEAYGILAPQPGNRNFTPCTGSVSCSGISNSLWPHDCSQGSLWWGITLMGAGYKSLTMETDVLAFYLVPKRISGEWSGRSATWESRFPDLFYSSDSEFIWRGSKQDPRIHFLLPSPFLESHKVHQAMQGIRGRCVPGSRERGWEMVQLKDHQQQEMEQRASWNFTQAWRWWNTHLRLWKVATWRFISRAVTVHYTLSSTIFPSTKENQLRFGIKMMYISYNHIYLRMYSRIKL